MPCWQLAFRSLRLLITEALLPFPCLAVQTTRSVGPDSSSVDAVAAQGRVQRQRPAVQGLGLREQRHTVSRPPITIFSIAAAV